MKSKDKREGCFNCAHFAAFDCERKHGKVDMVKCGETGVWHKWNYSCKKYQ